MEGYELGQTKFETRSLLNGTAKGRAVDLGSDQVLGSVNGADHGSFTINRAMTEFPPALFRRIAAVSRRVELGADQLIFSPGDKIEWIYFPETAVLSELKVFEDGRTIESSMIGPEGIAGLTAVLAPAVASNWLQVTAAGNAIRIDRILLQKIIGQNEQALAAFQGSVSQHIKQITVRAACNAYHSVRERFSTWLLMLNDRCAGEKLRLTHEQCARSLGVYRPSITCIAQELRSEGVIDYSRGSIVIADLSRLKQACCECYFELAFSTGLKLHPSEAAGRPLTFAAS
jgi:CRP-like cAMP-binding protein